LVVLSLQTTIELAALAEHVERALTAINLILSTVTALMVFRATITPSPNISDYQRALFAVVALCLLFAPGFMSRMWPWAIKVLLAQIYGAPFLSYGLGSLYAAREFVRRPHALGVAVVR
jgi:hypothetical protein